MSIEAAAPPPRETIFSRLRGARDAERARVQSNQFVLRAIEEEKFRGQRIATIARTIALVLIGLFVPFVNPTWGVLYYEAFLLVFIAIGWAQLRFAQVGQSRIELALIFLDLALLTFVCVVPSPFLNEEIPTAFTYRFGVFIYFYVLLASGMLAYSWRTILSIGTWVSVLWLGGLVAVIVFGHRMPELSEAVQLALEGHPTLAAELDPNMADVGMRVQEIVVFVIVAGILALKGWRMNELLMRQAEIAAERANLSRYFSPNLVDLLASHEHDVGAVRNQEIAVMFVDIVGFTEIAEHSTPKDVMHLLRRYHAVIEKAVFENGGTLDKYLGDGVMATFGTPEATPDDAANALKAARQMIDAMAAFNSESKATGAPELKVSVGVHYGPVILGDIGPARRLEFAVVGDTVNVASRLETATRDLGCNIVVSDALVSRIRQSGAADSDETAGLTHVHDITLRGRKAPMEVWTA